ncbi:MAG: adenine phosphoribosyltransferase [bacterium (Candidatus Stahlbacteria) CG08_land_8_20_14_0_20_40_26]|nr:MAG: adenine phosphoribosyltransferase [bacterium (Candidatus Stahlbacteria) CG23_combo_of_CG06-09_8_20_14_all_40_9]PIS26147.1 MAG: adenine phosphoribosyltransferase [bacterium (Candidatus Stahlbacteria) CG08_land_8_20_14_0_20_40_26]
MEDLKRVIRSIPDFPKKGILFRDITPLLEDRDTFRKVIDIFAEYYKDKEIDKIVSVEARGFIFSGALSYIIDAGIVLVRKPGKLPYKVIKEDYELEYGKNILEVHRDAIKKGEKVLVFDDLLATGGTASAICRLVERLGGEVISVAFLIELESLKGREKLKDYDVYTLLRYD